MIVSGFHHLEMKLRIISQNWLLEIQEIGVIYTQMLFFSKPLRVVWVRIYDGVSDDF
jgi:hypothetical protein